MKTKTFISLLSIICCLTIHAKTVYVDSNSGDDNNSGTEEAPVLSIKKAAEIIRSSDNDFYVMKINPGIYVLKNHVLISTEKNMTGKRIIIEASVLPGDDAWAPEKMPIIISTAKKGEIEWNYHFVVAFLIDENHVTIRGLKFHGYFYPNSRYFPIARLNKKKTDLFVQQCMFVGDKDASHIQVGVIAHGDSVRIDHCIFHNVRNSVVFWQDSGNGIKTGNAIINSIIYGTTQSGIWTAWPDKDFVFKNNIVSNCKHFWITNEGNPTVYTIENCIIVNNNHYKVKAKNTGLIPEEFELIEKNVIKEGEISLRPKKDVVHLPLPDDYLHIIQDSLGYEIGAGLFKTQ